MQRDPDAALVALFKQYPKKNEVKSLEAGRPVFDDVEVCEIRKPGSKDFSVHLASEMSHWDEIPGTGELFIVTYAERFRHQYQQFKSKVAQTKSGTPLDYIPFLTEARRAELRAQNVYTVEALALVDGNELKNLGPGGRDLKNEAMAFIETSRQGAGDQQLMMQLEAAKARNAVLEGDLARLRDGKIEFEPEPPKTGAARYEDMSNEQLRNFITAQSGQVPLGSMARKTLIRMAQECVASTDATAA